MVVKLFKYFCHFFRLNTLEFFSERKQEMEDGTLKFEEEGTKEKVAKPIEQRYGLFIENTDDADAENSKGMDFHFI